MPSASKSQYKLMQFAAINAKFAEKKGIKQETAKEWHEADKKKKAEDPEWYENLPDKFEKKKEESEVSTEGVGSLLGKIFGGSPGEKMGLVEIKEDYQFIYQAREVVEKTYLNATWLNEKELRVGPINVADQSHRLQFPSVPHNLLDAVEKFVNEGGNYMLTYAKSVHNTADAIIEKWHSIKNADEILKEDTAFEKFFFDKIHKVNDIRPPIHGLGNFIVVQKPIGAGVDWRLVSQPGVKLSAIPAFTKDQIRKGGQVIVKILDFMDKFDDLWDEERKDIFDFKEAWRHVSSLGKDHDHYAIIFAILDFESIGYDNHTTVRKTLLDAAIALDVLMSRSIK